MTSMRKAISLAVLALVSFGCQPKILIFNAQPSSAAAGPVKVTLNWKISAGGGTLSANQPVTPSLDPPLNVNIQGSKSFDVCKTTTFKLELPYGGERTVTVTVANPCDAPQPCVNQTLHFTGTCVSAMQGPSYGPQTVSAAPGNLKDLQSDADFPIHVLHAGADIALGANGGPLFPPIPIVPTAGEYHITVPGQVGLNVCQEATNPVGGGQTEAPPINLTVVPTCPTP